MICFAVHFTKQAVLESRVSFVVLLDAVSICSGIQEEIRMKFKALNIINVLNTIKRPGAESKEVRKQAEQELKNCLDDTSEVVDGLDTELLCKFSLWNGIMNNYGIYGAKREQARRFKRLINGEKTDVTYYDKRFGRGKLLSIDFGLSNIGRELSYTHTGIVIADYVGTVVVIPITSKKESELTKLSPDIRKIIIPFDHEEYSVLEEDSYILINQMRAVSKNRITKIIGSIAGTKLMKEIESKLMEVHSPYINKLYNEKLEEQQKKITELTEKLKKYE